MYINYIVLIGTYLKCFIIFFSAFHYTYRLGYARGIPRRTKSKDDDTHSESPSPLRIGGTDDVTIDGGESGGNTTDRSMPAPEEPPYFPEQW